MSGDDRKLIEKARSSVVPAYCRTLYEALRQWLARLGAGEKNARSFDALMRRMQHVSAGGHYTRDEMNER